MLNDRIIWKRFEEKQAQDSFSWRLFNLSSLGGVWVAPDPECGHKPNLQTHPRSLLLSNAHFWEFAGFGGFANGGGSWCDAGGGPLASEFNHSLCSNPNVPRNELRIAQKYKKGLQQVMPALSLNFEPFYSPNKAFALVRWLDLGAYSFFNFLPHNEMAH